MEVTIYISPGLSMMNTDPKGASWSLSWSMLSLSWSRFRSWSCSSSNGSCLTFELRFELKFELKFDEVEEEGRPKSRTRMEEGEWAFAMPMPMPMRLWLWLW